MTSRTRPARDDTFVAFDTETTGLSPVDDRVVEVAALAFRADGSEIASMEQLTDPGIAIPPELTKIHGITDDMVRGKPSIEEVLPGFVAFTEGSVLVAHNSPYDVAMLMVPLLAMRRRSQGPSVPGNLVLDTCALARAVFPGAPNYRLGTVAALLGVTSQRAHRAMSDVVACKGVFVKILQKALETAGSEGTLEDLVKLNGSEMYMGISGAAGSPQRELLEMSMGVAGGPLAPLRDALENGTQVAIRYQGGTKGNAPRLISPITLMAQEKVTYVVAHCHVDRALKHFRLDKILEVLPVPA